MRIGIIGGATGLAARAAAAGLEPVARVADAAEAERLRRDGIATIAEYVEFFEALEHPRLFVLDLPIGAAVDATLDEAYVVMEPSDVVIDPSGSYWCDTLRRFRRMRHRSLYYVDVAEIATPAGRHLFASGDRKGVEMALPALRRLAAPGTASALGEAGAAHFLLMVMDGVRTALAHAHSEARQLLEAFPIGFDVAAVVEALDLEAAGTEGRAAWLLDDALRLESAVPLLAHAVMLEAGAALDDRRPMPQLPRQGPFVHPDDVL